MRFLVDSCISSYAVKALRGAGFDVAWIPETGTDPGDEAIIQRSVDEDLVLITSRSHHPPRSIGIGAIKRAWCTRQICYNKSAFTQGRHEL